MLQTEYTDNKARLFFSDPFPEEIKFSEFIKETKIAYGDAQRVLIQFGYEEESRGIWKKSKVLE